MKAIIGFSRIVVGVNELLGNLTFLTNDYYDIFHHMVMDSEFKNTESALRVCGFRVVPTDATDTISIQTCIPPMLHYQLSTGGPAVKIDFGKYGKYEISLLELES